MVSENITSCPVCEHQNFSEFLRSKDFTVTGEEFELKKCDQCNMIITSPRPTQESIGKYYASENYISHSGKSKTLFDKIYLNARRITLKWKYQIISEYYQSPANILDYGCGTGEFLNFMKKKDWQIIGIEPAEHARQKAKQLLENKVFSDLSNIKPSSLEIITLWHVLEHIHDLNNTIQKLKSFLTKSGHLLIAVPNPNSHDCQHYKDHWAGYDVPRHLWHFTQETMTALLKKNGLKVVDIKPMKLDSYYVSLLSENYKNPQQAKLTSAIKAFIEGSTSNLFAAKTKNYSSIIYIAKTE